MKELKFICEEWKNISGFTGYEVSNLGNIRSINRFSGKRRGIIKGKNLVQVPNKKGYLEVRLFNNSKPTLKVVHRLVANSFIINNYNKPQVNHIDGNKLNNRVDNLEWMTNSENQKHAYKLGLQHSRIGENNTKTNLTNNKVTIIKELYNSGKFIKEVSEITGVSLVIIRQIINRRSWKSNTTPILKRDDRLKPITI